MTLKEKIQREAVLETTVGELICAITEAAAECVVEEDISEFAHLTFYSIMAEHGSLSN